MDTKAIETHIRGILEAIGEDPDREGLRETPQRVARMYEEIFAGIAYSNHEIAQMFGKTFTAPSAEQIQTAVVYQRIQLLRAPYGAHVRHACKCGICSAQPRNRPEQNCPDLRHGRQAAAIAGKVGDRYCGNPDGSR